MKKILIFLLALSICINVNAKSLCSNEEKADLNAKAANIKFNYDIKEEHISGEYVYTERHEKINILNLTEEFYAVVTNDINKDKYKFTYNDTKNGMIEFDWNHLDKVTNFTLVIYTSNKTKCPDERMKTFKMVTPRYNYYSEREICSQYKDASICQEYVTFTEVSEEEYGKMINKEIKKNQEEKPKEKEKNKIVEFFKNNKWYIIGFSSIVLVAIVVSILIKHKKDKELGL